MCCQFIMLRMIQHIYKPKLGFTTYLESNLFIKWVKLCSYSKCHVLEEIFYLSSTKCQNMQNMFNLLKESLNDM